MSAYQLFMFVCFVVIHFLIWLLADRRSARLQNRIDKLHHEKRILQLRIETYAASEEV